MQVSTRIKSEGDERFNKEDYYDALWKYEFFVQFTKNFPQFDDLIALVQCNAAFCCLKLGKTKQRQLICYKDENYWFCFCCYYADSAIGLTPNPQVLFKVFHLCLWLVLGLDL